jgi:hypothetical protein
VAILPLIMTPQGLQPRLPADIRAEIVSRVEGVRPGYTANLPAALIEDVASTETAAVVESDQFLVDLVNSVSPWGANPFMLKQLGDVYDVQPKQITNTSVYMVFYGPPGFVIVQGFTVGDGAYSYVCQEGGIIGEGRQSLPIYAVSPTAGAWAVPAGTVTELLTSVPSSIMASGFGAVNPADGLPASMGESIESYRDRVWTAGLAASTGMKRYLSTLLWRIPGVQKRLVSVRQDLVTGRYIVMVGGGDPYQVGYAIYFALFWTVGLLPAAINIVGISNDNPAVVTTASKHNLQDGMVERIDGVDALGSLGKINGQSFPVTTLGDTAFSIPFDNTPLSSAYVSGGVVTPNPIVEEVTINDWPDHYLIPYVIPAAERVAITAVWVTDSPNYVSQSAVDSAARPAILDYVNSIPCGLTPLSIYELENAFLDAADPVLPRESVVSLRFDVSIDGVGVLPESGTGMIPGDINGYFSLDTSDLTILERGQGGGGGGSGGAPAGGLVVEAAHASFVNVAGDAMAGPLHLASDPTQPLEAASKRYVDTRKTDAGSF